MIITAVALAIVSEAGMGFSVWATIISVQVGSWQDALASVLLFIAAALVLFLSYGFVYTAGKDVQSEKMWDKAVNRRVLTLKPGQSMAFRLIPGEDSYVTVRPEPGQWTTTRIEPVRENDGTDARR